jgi:hypothetical protein
MLSAIRAVIRRAATGDKQRYYEADLRMRLSIIATRRAFSREGAGHICGFAI